ncbi:MAG: hypothetical protein WDZ96_03265 [Acidimicrobiia bacterium]
MSSLEFAEWMAYEKVTGPFGGERMDVLHAVQMALIHNQWAKKPRKPKDFLPEWDRKKAQTPEEMLAMLRAITGVKGGEEKHGDDR